MPGSNGKRKAMPTRFARRMDIVKASEIREILKVTVRPEVISFAGGLPAPELFPVADLKRAAQAVLERSGREALQYSTTQGHLPLREAIALRMARAYGLRSSPDVVLVTSGSGAGPRSHGPGSSRWAWTTREMSSVGYLAIVPKAVCNGQPLRVRRVAFVPDVYRAHPQRAISSCVRSPRDVC